MNRFKKNASWRPRAFTAAARDFIRWPGVFLFEGEGGRLAGLDVISAHLIDAAFNSGWPMPSPATAASCSAATTPHPCPWSNAAARHAEKIVKADRSNPRTNCRPTIWNQLKQPKPSHAKSNQARSS